MTKRKYRTIEEWTSIYTTLYLNDHLTVSDIARKLGHQISTVSRIFKKLKLPVQSNPEHKVLFDDHAFDIWNNISAYWLGFIAADGSIYAPKKTLSVSVKKDDKNHLYKLAQFLKTNKKIYEYERLLKGKPFTQCYLNVVSRYLIDKLASLGIVQNKSNKDIDYLSHIPDQYKLSFMFGFMDGDGHLRIRDRGRGEIAWLGTSKIIESISRYLSSIGIRNSLNTRKECGLRLCLIYSMNDRVRILKDYINHPVYLERKHKKAIEMLSIIEKCKSYKD